MQLHPAQRKIAQSLARFKVTRAGRKGGKTAYEVESLAYKATEKAECLNLSKTTFPTGRKVLYIAPTQSQARKIIWQALMTKFAGVGKANETLLEMKVPNLDGETTTIYVGGWENRENYRGLADVVHITVDEVDTLKDFFLSWKEIFRPMFLDTGGTADFIGTPQKRNPNLRRLEIEAEGRKNWECFHFTSKDNPHLSRDELKEILEDYEGDPTSYRQEILAEHVEDEGALFRYTSLTDMFSNAVDESKENYLTVDIADDGSDKTIFTYWRGLDAYEIQSYSQMRTEGIIEKIREDCRERRIPYSHVAVDAIGVGAGVASSSMLEGIIGFKSSYSAIKTDQDPIYLPNVKYRKDVRLTTDYKNLRCQCVFTLADYVNNHKISVSFKDEATKEKIIAELGQYQDVTVGDVKRMATPKEDVKEVLGRSPDTSDTLIMRMFFELKKKVMPHQSEQLARVVAEQDSTFRRNREAVAKNECI